MTTFAPNFGPNPENIDDVFVHSYWSFNREYMTWIPANLNLIRLPQFNNEIFGFPNSLVQRMSLDQYKEEKNNVASSIANTIWTNANRNADNPIDEINGKLIYAYRFIDALINPVLTRAYDLAEDDEKNNILQQILDDLKNIQLLRDDLLPVFTPAIDVNFDINNLFLTYCRYEKDTNLFFDCNKCLPFEFGWLSIMDSPVVMNVFPRRRLPDRIGRQPMPNCALCRKYVVYCSDLNGFGMGPARSIVIEPVSEDVNYPEHAEFFYTLTEAEDFRTSKILAGSKWVCAGEDFWLNPAPVVPRKNCYEISEFCAEYFSDDFVIYNSLEECEENCPHPFRWYCIEGDCVKLESTDPAVQGLIGNNTKAECEAECLDPTQTPQPEPSPTPTPTPTEATTEEP